MPNAEQTGQENLEPVDPFDELSRPEMLAWLARYKAFTPANFLEVCHILPYITLVLLFTMIIVLADQWADFLLYFLSKCK